MSSSPKRSFTIESAEVSISGILSSRFESRYPRGAAIKAAHRLLKMNPKKKEIKFAIRETTQGSKGKVSHYIGFREKLDKPKKIERDGVTVEYRYQYNVRVCS